jgi:hypothetical protein
MQWRAPTCKRPYACGVDAAGEKQPLHPGLNNKNNSATTAQGRNRDQGGIPDEF